jgi:hypothetical protein
MRKYLLALACSVAFAIATPAAAWANQTPGGTPAVTPTTGQHGSNAGNSCPGTTGTPGNAGSASNTGSPFNGDNTKLYAGNPDSGSLHANSTAAVSQYDVACF